MPLFRHQRVCTSGPEEDLAQGGRFPYWFQRFVKLFFKNEYPKKLFALALETEDWIDRS